MKLKTLKSKFPLYTDRLAISVIGVRNIDEYSKEIVKDYFLEYLDNRSILNLTQEEIKYKLGLLITSYSSNQEFIYEFRLLIKDRSTHQLYGGITLMPKANNTELEIAYWVKPKYQGNGIATEALNGITKFIRENIKSVTGVTLEIQEVNIASIKIAEKCGFGQRSISRGAYCNNVEYSLAWRK